jgi:hypothetical protein
MITGSLSFFSEWHAKRKEKSINESPGDKIYN